MDLDAVDAIVVAVLSLGAVAAVGATDLAIATFVGGDLLTLLRSVAVLLIMLPLPVAYVASISMERFRPESLASAAGLVFAVRGTAYTAVAAGLVLASLLVSYKARSVFHGDNRFWTRFKASTSAVTALALIIGLTVALTYQGSAGFRADLQGNVTNVTTELAVDQIGATQQSLAEQQRQLVVTTAGTVAENSSTAAILLTEQNVLAAVQQDGSFSASQQQVLDDAFTTSEQDIPPQVRSEVEQRIARQYDENIDDGLVETRDLEDRITTQVRNMLARLAEPTPPVLVALFIMAASFALIFKLPFGLVAAIYASIIALLVSRFRPGTAGSRGAAETDAGRGETADEA